MPDFEGNYNNFKDRLDYGIKVCCPPPMGKAYTPAEQQHIKEALENQQ